MKKFTLYSILLTVAMLTGCTTDDNVADNAPIKAADPHELTTIHPVIVDGAAPQNLTRAGEVTRLMDYVGRSEFKTNDVTLFTNIRRTADAIDNFIYPGAKAYEGITFNAIGDGGWSRVILDESVEHERIYWTDAESNHTFVAYSKPQGYKVNADDAEETPPTFDWKIYNYNGSNYYIGSIGDPLDNGDIDYTLTAEEQALPANKKQVKNVWTYYNPKLENEDLLIAHDTKVKAEPGGSVAVINYHHALSSIRVVVNINGFASSSSAVDIETVVSDMKLLNQPTMYIWQQSKWGVEPMRADNGLTVTDQEMINTAWNNNGNNLPPFNQRKDMKLWIPNPAGVGTNQSKTFTFYGITTPQPSTYMSTIDADSDNRIMKLTFKVTYPNPLNPNTTVTKDYTASLKDVFFEAGYNTTINVTLNHENEEMTVGAQYENWQFVATPDQGNLRKNSTFLQSTSRDSVTIVGDALATADDATWLYELGGNIYDIYGHTGTESDPYQISTAYQLLSFAYEVSEGNGGSGRNFTGKFIRLDADLTLQTDAEKVKEEIVYSEDTKSAYDNAKTALSWIGIGAADKPFNGTFIGGNRFIYRLQGKPLFAELGPQAQIERLNVGAIILGNDKTKSAAVEGGGLFAENSAGLICACRVMGDVSLSGTGTGRYVGAFVGKNYLGGDHGRVFASYHIGDTNGVAGAGESIHTGGLIGDNSGGTISSCYQAGNVTGTTTRGVTGNSTGTISNTYFNSSLCTPTETPASGVTPKTAAEMTKQSFVNELNAGIVSWRESHSDYHNHSYTYQAANYPKLAE